MVVQGDHVYFTYCSVAVVRDCSTIIILGVIELLVREACNAVVWDSCLSMWKYFSYVLSPVLSEGSHTSFTVMIPGSMCACCASVAAADCCTDWSVPRLTALHHPVPV